ncbi:hypothetical protein BJB45_10205 [Halomonas huangheensis]|uniref:Hydrolase n=2 Tax=Halomonas huangheensis TaxID=1178482 RepID=W1NBQ0_9GAMM|nr:hypothetical protein BJB45_10205 [Halomonas huangheensis]
MASMDSLTQAALGAALSGAIMGRRLGRKSLLIGAALGTLPDLDVVIDYGDAVTNVTYHRGFSHSLFVLTGLATLLALVARRLAPARDISLQHWWWLFWLCLITHPLLDAITTYGTQLWWPLTVSQPSALPLVFIIDPLYSLPLVATLLVGLALGDGRRIQRLAGGALMISCLYLLLSLGIRHWVEHRVAPALAEHQLADAPRLVQPTPFNILLWRVTAVDGNRHAETTVGVFDGDTPPLIEIFQRGAELEPAALAIDKGRRLDWFAGPFLQYEIVSADDRQWLMATDMRLGFPGNHSFRFSLAVRADDGADWQALPVTQQLPDEGQYGSLARLFQRLRSPTPPLCLSQWTDPRWHTDGTATCR